MQLRAITATITTAAATAAAVLIPAVTSEAGVYHYYACRVPYGAEAGRTVGVEDSSTPGEPGAWSHSSKGTGSYGDLCGSNAEPGRTALSAALPAGVEHTPRDISTWEFSAPAGEKIQGATLWRAGDTEGGEGYEFWLATPDNPSALETFSNEDTFDGCIFNFECTTLGTTSEPLATQNKVLVEEHLGGSHLYLNASCSDEPCEASTGDEAGYAVVVYLYAADFLLEESAAPTVSGQAGPLVTASTVSGEAGVSFDAEDEGSGVYEETMKVDGETVSKQVINEQGGSCKPVEVAGDGHLAFLSAKPCPASAEGKLSLDTTTLSNGEHEVLVTVSNAAGVEAVVLDRTIDVANEALGGSSGSGGGSEGGSGGSQSGGSGSTTGSSGSSGSEGASSGGGTTANGVNASTAAKLVAWWARAAAHRRSKSGKSHPKSHKGHRRTRRHTRHRVNHRTPKHTRGHARNRERRHERRHPRQHSHHRTRHHTRRSHAAAIRFGGSGEIEGSLTTSTGKPIADATLDVLYTPSFGGAKQRRMGSVKTNAKGGFALKLRKGLSSRRITIEYSSSVGGKPVAFAHLTLKVHAGVTLHVSPKRTSAGHTISLSGRVLGSPLPKGGKQVVLQAKSKGSGWMTFAVLTTNAHGGFHSAHRFRLPGPVHYEFRAVCPHEADFPFSAGASKAVGVFER